MALSLRLLNSQSLIKFGSLIGGTLNLALARDALRGGDPARQRLVELEVEGADEVHPHDGHGDADEVHYEADLHHEAHRDVAALLHDGVGGRGGGQHEGVGAAQGGGQGCNVD